MNPRSLRLAPLLALAMLTGCIGAEDPVEGASMADAPPDAGETSPAPAPPTPSTPMDDAPGREADTTPEADPVAPVPVEIPLAFEGSFPTFAEGCVSTPVGSRCESLFTAGAFDNRFELALQGTVATLELTLTWQASSPAMERLSVSFHSRSDGEVVEHAEAFGASPLTVALQGPVVLPEGWTHRLGVGVPSYGGAADVPGAGVRLGTEQEFTLEGLLVLEPPAG